MVSSFSFNLDESTLPNELIVFLQSSVLEDSSSSVESRTYKVIKDSEIYFLKIGPSELLSREVDMNRFFNKFGLGPEAELFCTRVNKGYLVTRALSGENGISKSHLSKPEKLAQSFGESLQKIHGLPVSECPIYDRSDEMLNQALNNINIGKCADYLIPEGFMAGKKRFDELRGLAKVDSVIHGDYCLPNIILQNFDLVGFVDLGNGGYGDSHHDLYWGLWTLNYNLKTEKYNTAFLEAYGKDKVDHDRIEFHRILSGFMY
jgi:kanamycin kinase